MKQAEEVLQVVVHVDVTAIAGRGVEPVIVES
jgi:hypothetical protein